MHVSRKSSDTEGVEFDGLLIQGFSIAMADVGIMVAIRAVRSIPLFSLTRPADSLHGILHKPLLLFP